jgi:hypothetical protein
MPSDNYLQNISKNIFKNKDILICDNHCSTFDCVYRTVVNRSYYAAYSHAKNWAEVKLKYNEDEYLEKLREEKKKVGRHQTLIIFIHRKAKEEKHKVLANKLKSIKTLRTDADYHFDKKINEEDADFSIQAANSIINYLN